jgi:hypothetical protein
LCFTGKLRVDRKCESFGLQRFRDPESVVVGQSNYRLRNAPSNWLHDAEIPDRNAKQS